MAAFDPNLHLSYVIMDQDLESKRCIRDGCRTEHGVYCEYGERHCSTVWVAKNLTDV